TPRSVSRIRARARAPSDPGGTDRAPTIGRVEAALPRASRGIQFVRVAIVVALFALVAILALGFRRDLQDIRTGTVGHPAPAFDLERLDQSGRLRLADLGG